MTPPGRGESETLGLLCAECEVFIEFELPVTFFSPPLCVRCEDELAEADVPVGETLPLGDEAAA